MISDQRENDRSRRTLVWAALLSAVLHAILAPLAAWMWSANWTLVSARRPQAERVVASTSVRIERRSVAQPPVLGARAQTPPAPRPQPQRIARAQPAAPRLELVRPAPTASPMPTPTPEKRHDRPAPPALAQQLAQQERRFSQEVAQLNGRNNPLSIAPVRREPPAAFRRAYFDVPGRSQRDAVQIELFALRHWYAGTAICYYARYVAQYSSGASEDGVIPWPVCYPVGDDRIANPPYVHPVPIPYPQADYVLPPGTYLTPLLQGFYNKRAGR